MQPINGLDTLKCSYASLKTSILLFYKIKCSNLVIISWSRFDSFRLIFKLTATPLDESFAIARHPEGIRGSRTGSKVSLN